MKPNNKLSQDLDEQLAMIFEIREPVLPAVVHDEPPVLEVVPAAEVPIRKSCFTFERLISALLALGILSCLGGFFLYVPVLPTITVAVLLSGLLAMFWIGFHLGGKRVRC